MVCTLPTGPTLGSRLTQYMLELSVFKNIIVNLMTVV